LEITYQEGGSPISINSHDIQVIKDTQNSEYEIIYIKNINLPNNNKMYIFVIDNLENKEETTSNKDVLVVQTL